VKKSGKRGREKIRCIQKSVARKVMIGHEEEAVRSGITGQSWGEKTVPAIEKRAEAGAQGMPKIVQSP